MLIVCIYENSLLVFYEMMQRYTIERKPLQDYTKPACTTGNTILSMIIHIYIVYEHQLDNILQVHAKIKNFLIKRLEL